MNLHTHLAPATLSHRIFDLHDKQMVRLLRPPPGSDDLIVGRNQIFIV
jgi:hypothetical protein